MPELPPTKVLRVVVAEDNYLVREGVRRILEHSGEIHVVAGVGSAPELVSAVGKLHPDVVVSDIRMPPGQKMEGIESAHAIRRRTPTIGVVILSQHADEAYVLELLKEGTAGLAYLLKDRVGEPLELVNAVRTVAAGGSVIDPLVVETLVGSRSRIEGSPLASLTSREGQVLREMAQGKTNRGIAVELSLSESAIEKHVSSIFLKLGLSQGPSTDRRVSAVLTYLHDRDASS